ncbi:MAG: ATP-binding cassette domain-containing protein [Mediterraneibacter faecis]
MTAKENLEVQMLQKGVGSKKDIASLLRTVGLEEAGRKKAKNFSLGMRQRLALAIALINNPDFLVLDEPTNGLDPTGIMEIRNLLLRLNQGKRDHYINFNTYFIRIAFIGNILWNS